MNGLPNKCIQADALRARLMPSLARRRIAMKKAIVMLLVFSALQATAQELKIPEDRLFSKEANTLQPLAIMMIPGAPIVSFCPGFSGGFDEIQIEDNSSNMVEQIGQLVTAILVDKREKKIIDDIDCYWESSDSKVLIATQAAHDNRRLFALLPQKAGAVILTITMGNEQTKLKVIISNTDDAFTFQVDSAENGKNQKANRSSEATSPKGAAPQ